MKFSFWKPLGVGVAIAFFAVGFRWVMHPQKISLQEVPLPQPRYMASEETKATATVAKASGTKAKTARKSKLEAKK